MISASWLSLVAHAVCADAAMVDLIRHISGKMVFHGLTPQFDQQANRVYDMVIVGPTPQSDHPPSASGTIAAVRHKRTFGRAVSNSFSLRTQIGLPNWFSPVHS